MCRTQRRRDLGVRVQGQTAEGGSVDRGVQVWTSKGFFTQAARHQNCNIVRADVRKGLTYCLMPSFGSDVKFDVDVKILLSVSTF